MRLLFLGDVVGRTGRTIVNESPTSSRPCRELVTVEPTSTQVASESGSAIDA